MDTEKSYIIIGAGNVAKSLCANLHEKGYRLSKVISTSESSQKLANIYQASSSTSVKDIPEDIDFLILSVKDDALKLLVSQIKNTKIPVFHTSGSVPAEVFEGHFSHYGVLYPLQTFSDEIVSMNRVPMIIEANDDLTFGKLSKIAHDISDQVYPMNSEKRRWIHLAAVYACNFTNHMQTIAGDILTTHDISPEIIKPLLEETFRKAIEGEPRQNQTGPARRGDLAILESHTQMLKNHKEYQEIYSLISKHILKTYLMNNK